MADHAIVLYTRHDCHLCERAHAIVSAAAADYGLTMQVVDVDSSEALRTRYGATVPVIAVEGHVVQAGRVSDFQLRRALGLPRTPRAIAGLGKALCASIRGSEARSLL